jgi:hypothetical protein
VSLDAYRLLAVAILRWARADRSGLRHEQLAAEARLRELAAELYSEGYR